MTLPSFPKAVFFDWDGTLVDSFAFLHAAHNHTRAQFGMEPFALEVFAGYFGQPREKLYAEIYGRENIEAAKGHFEAFVTAHHLEHLKPQPGAQALLEALESLDVPCGVITNKKRTLVEAEISNYGWDKHFISVVGAGDATEDKPSAAPLLFGIEKAGFGFALNDIWLVGDTDNDLLCAERAGCVSVLVLPDVEAPDLLEKHQVHLHKQNCKELAEFLLQYGAEQLKSNQ